MVQTMNLHSKQEREVKSARVKNGKGLAQTLNSLGPEGRVLCSGGLGQRPKNEIDTEAIRV